MNNDSDSSYKSFKTANFLHRLNPESRVGDDINRGEYDSAAKRLAVDTAVALALQGMGSAALGALRAEASVAAKSAAPRGFASAEQFGQASTELRTALRSHRITDATIRVRGSSVTGTSFKTGQPFGPASDIDFFVVSAQLTNGLKTSSSIPGFVHPDRVMKAFPELRAWSES